MASSKQKHWLPVRHSANLSFVRHKMDMNISSGSDASVLQDGTIFGAVSFVAELTMDCKWL